MFKLNKEDRLHRDAVRGKYLVGHHWYAVMTHWGQEILVRDQIVKDLSCPQLNEVHLPELVDAGDESPKRKDNLLFSGYLFLNCQMHDDLYLAVCGYPKVFRILGPGFRIPACIPDVEIQYLKGILAILPRPEMMPRSCRGQLVEVTTGLLTGLRGRILEVGATHVKIETAFSFLGVESGIAVKLPQNCLRLIEHSDARRQEDQIRHLPFPGA